MTTPEIRPCERAKCVVELGTLRKAQALGFVTISSYEALTVEGGCLNCPDAVETCASAAVAGSGLEPDKKRNLKNWIFKLSENS